MTDKAPPEDNPAATTPPKGKFVKGVSGNPAGRPKGSRNAITTQRLETEQALREFLQPYARRVLKKAIDMALAGDAKMIAVILDKTMSSLRTEDVGESKDTNVVVNINDMTSVARSRRVTVDQPAIEGEFEPVKKLDAPTVTINAAPATKTKTQTTP